MLFFSSHLIGNYDTEISSHQVGVSNEEKISKKLKYFTSLLILH